MAQSLKEIASSDVSIQLADLIGISEIAIIIILAIITVWTIIWTGLALWKSARKNHLIWFVVLLLINTAGILEILYIYVFSELGKKSSKTKPKKSKK